MREYNQSNTILHLPAFEVICTSHKKEHIFICMCVCPCTCGVCEEDRHERREKIEKTKRKLIHTDKQTDGQTNRQTSFIGIRYNTEQYSKSNRIESNRTQIEYK